MELQWVPVRKWRQMSDAEQRALIRAGVTDLEDLPEDFRREVEEMLAKTRPLAS